MHARSLTHRPIGDAEGPAGPVPGAPRSRTRDRAAWLARVPPVYWALAALVVALGIVSPRSIEPRHLLDIGSAGADLGLVAIGQTCVLMAGGLDLSVGANVLLVDVVAAQVIAGHEDRILLATVLVLSIGAAIGLLNGILVTRFRVTPFIATLGTGLLISAIALIYSGGTPGGSIPAAMFFWGNGSIAGVFPASLGLWLAVALLVALLLKRTVLGPLLIGVGANPRAAHVSGIHVDRVRVLAYVLCGTLTAAGGWLLVAYVGTATLEIGTNFLMGSFAAAIIGGTLLTGGRGSISGTIGGTLFLMVLYTMLAVMNLPESGRNVIEGGTILGAVALANARSQK
jgi:ribose transport system permease protein